MLLLEERLLLSCHGVGRLAHFSQECMSPSLANSYCDAKFGTTVAAVKVLPQLTNWSALNWHAFQQGSYCLQAGTYGVLVLFGVIPAAMIYSERYWKTTLTSVRVVPEGRLLMAGVGGFALLIIANELQHSLLSLGSVGAS